MSITTINQAIAPYKAQLLQHTLYQKITTISDLHCFQENHVYAVWDFMSLLKSLQNQLTCTSIPWYASENPTTRYLINEIVVAEESDLTIDGRRLSHFEMYIEAMEACGANTQTIMKFVDRVKNSNAIFQIIQENPIHHKVKDFLNFTFSTIANGKAHEIAAAFTFGREDLIPTMFTAILKNIQQNFPESDLSKFIYYFERHIALDADEHSPMAMEMVAALCGHDAQKWEEVAIISKEALIKRIGLWDAIEETLAK